MTDNDTSKPIIVSSNKKMLMFEAYLKDTNQTKEEYDAKIEKKYKKYEDDDNTAIPVIVPLIKKQIKCSQLKKSQIVVYDNKVCEITNFSKIPNKNLRSFIVFHNYTNTKKEFIFPKTYIFEINEDGCIVLS